MPKTTQITSGRAGTGAQTTEFPSWPFEWRDHTASWRLGGLWKDLRLLWPLLPGLVPHCAPWKWLQGRREDGRGAEPEGEALGSRQGKRGRKGCREGLCPSRGEGRGLLAHPSIPSTHQGGSHPTPACLLTSRQTQAVPRARPGPGGKDPPPVTASSPACW